MSLATDLAALLLAAPGKVAPANGSVIPVPPRPMERVRVRITYTRTQFGHAYIEMDDGDDPYAVEEKVQPTVEWDDPGDNAISMDDYDTETTVNEPEIDAWNDQFGDTYASDGYPMCSECGDSGPEVPISDTTLQCASCDADANSTTDTDD